MTSSNLIHIIRILNKKKDTGKKGKTEKKILEEIMIKKFPNLIKKYKPLYIRRSTNAMLMKSEENYSKTHIIKLLKISGKEKKTS